MVTVETIATTIVTAAIGVVFGWNGWRARRSQREALAEAQEVTARITAASVSRSRDRDEAAGEARTDHDYVPTLAFEYSFGGEQYESNNRYPPSETITRGGHESERAAREWLEEYEEGQQVTAYVNSDEPGAGFLEAETNSLRNTAMLVIGGLLTGSSLLGIVATVVLGL